MVRWMRAGRTWAPRARTLTGQDVDVSVFALVVGVIGAVGGDAHV